MRGQISSNVKLSSEKTQGRLAGGQRSNVPEATRRASLPLPGKPPNLFHQNIIPVDHGRKLVANNTPSKSGRFLPNQHMSAVPVSKMNMDQSPFVSVNTPRLDLIPQFSINTHDIFPIKKCLLSNDEGQRAFQGSMVEPQNVSEKANRRASDAHGQHAFLHVVGFVA